VTITENLLLKTFNIEKQEAMEVIMEDACYYLKPLSILRSEIIPCIYPKIYSLQLYPDLRDCAVLESLKACKMKKENQLRDRYEEVKLKVIESMS
jgi:hypothetical protein